jgi:hypothetical protein
VFALPDYHGEKLSSRSWRMAGTSTTADCVRVRRKSCIRLKPEITLASLRNSTTLLGPLSQRIEHVGKLR